MMEVPLLEEVVLTLPLKKTIPLEHSLPAPAPRSASGTANLSAAPLMKELPPIGVGVPALTMKREPLEPAGCNSPLLPGLTRWLAVGLSVHRLLRPWSAIQAANMEQRVMNEMAPLRCTQMAGVT